MESQGTHEFLLGIEEYLSNLGCKDQAARVHGLALALSKENSKLEVTKFFLQECVNQLKQTDLALADLVHKFGKTNNEQIDYCNALTVYVFNQAHIDQPLKDYLHKFSKSQLPYPVYINLLTYLMHQDNFDQTLKDFIFRTTKAESQVDYFKCLLLYLCKTMKDPVLRSLAHSLNKDNNEQFEIDFIKNSISRLEIEFPSDKFFRGINATFKNNLLEQEVINDAFSRSQIKSKFWLTKELSKIQKSYGNVLVMAGWFGQIKSIYEKFCTYQKMRILDLDRDACEVSDYVFNLSNLENHKVKSIVADINNLTLHKNGYEWLVENFKEPDKNYNEKFLPNLIINTSAEHMTEDWFHQIRFKQLESNPIVAIQSNNMFDIDEHVNCVHSVDHMKKKFPMKEVLYEGELQLKGYKRVMLIGRL